MSTAADGGIPQLYFCYECNHTVTITTPPPTGDLICPTCNGDFLEELENHPPPNVNPFAADHFSQFQDPLSSIFSGLPFLLSPPPPSSAVSVDLQNPRAFSSIFGQSRSFSQDPHAFDPYTFLQNHLSSLAAGGANVEFVIANNPSGQGLQLPANIGDFFVGPGLEQLIQQLSENDPNRYGAPPASKSSLEALPTITVDDALLSSDLAQCAVCKDDFEKGMEVKQMPCKHVYHSDCIIPWLELHNSCPVCRYELPTDDADYENRQGGRGSASEGSNISQGGGSEGSQGNSPGSRTADRRFRIALPWPFGMFGSPAQSSGGEFGNGSDQNDRASNSGGQQQQQNRDRQEDLD